MKKKLRQLCSLLEIDPLKCVKLSVDESEVAAVRIIEFCIEWRTVTGGLMKMDTILNHFTEDYSKAVIMSAINKIIHKLNSGFALATLNGVLFLQTAPVELLDEDLYLLQSSDQIVTNKDGWSLERYLHAVKSLVGKGLVWWDAVEDEHWIVAKFV
jgi:hypothetical protein